MKPISFLSLARWLVGSFLLGAPAFGQLLDTPTRVPVTVKADGNGNTQVDPEESFELTVAAPELGLDFWDQHAVDAGALSMNEVINFEPGKTYTFDVGGNYLGVFQLQVTAPAGYTVEINSVQTNDVSGEEMGNYKIRVVSDREGLSGRAGESSSLSAGKVYWQISLGSLKNGDSARGLAIVNAATGSWSDLFTPTGLSLHSSSPEIIPIGNPLRQVIANEAYVDIVTIDSTSYDIRFYNPVNTSLSGGSPIQGIPYTITGTPYLSYRVAQDGSATRLKVTRTDFKPDGNVARTCETALERTGTGVENYHWTLEDWHDTGVTAPLTENHTWSVNGQGQRVDTITREQGGVVSSRTVKEFKSFGTTEELSRITRGLTNPTDEYFEGLRIKWDNGGNWEAYRYDVASRITARFRPYGTSASSPPTPESDPTTWDTNTGEVTTYTYVPPTAFHRVHTIETRVNGTLMGRTVVDYDDPTSTTNGMRVVEASRSEQVDSGASTLTTVTRYYREDVSSGFYRNQIHSIQRPDGTKQSFAYQRGSFDGSTFTVSGTGSGLHARTIVINGSQTTGTLVSSVDGYTIDPICLVTNKSTEQIVIRDANARLWHTETRIWNGSAWVTASSVDYEYDYANRLTQRKTSNGATYTARYQDGADNETGRLQSERNESGVKVSYTYDSAGRIQTASKEGGHTTTFAYDGDGHVCSETISGSGETSIVNTRAYDDAGRLKTETPAGLGTTTYNYDPTARSRSTTFPTSTVTGTAGAITETLQPDGRLAKIEGTAVVPTYYSYDYQSGLWLTTVKSGSATSPRWQTFKTDWLGRTVEVKRPGFTGQSDYAETYTYSGARLTKLERTGLAPMLYEYDELSHVKRTGLGVSNPSGPLNPASDDRITDIAEQLDTAESSYWLRRTVTTYPVSGSASATMSSSTWTRLITDPNSSIKAEVRTIDPENNVVVTTTSVDRDAKNVTVTTTRPGFSGTETQLISNGLLASVTGHDGLITSFQYDALSRPWKTVDSRSNAVTRSYYAGTALVSSVTDGAGNPVSTVGYDSTGFTAWTRDAANNYAYFAYNERGQLVHQWGAATYPAEYEYDSTYGDRIRQRTYRNGSGWEQSTWPTNTSGVADATTWTFDDPSGFLWKKTDAPTTQHPSGTTVVLGYNNRGQVSQRQWARGVTTTYGYSGNTGELTDVTYSDGTPAVHYDYTRLGSLDNASDGLTGNHDFVYDTNKPWRLVNERLGSFYSSRVLTSLYESTGAVGRYAGFRLGASDNSSSELEQAYTYTGAGRFSSLATLSTPLSVTARTFQYGYRSDAALVNAISIVGDTHFNVTRNYEDHRDLLTVVDATWDSVSRTRYDYTYNALGQRDSAKQGGTAFDDFGGSTYYRHVYTSRGELSDATAYLGEDAGSTASPQLSGRHFAYEYDMIGNRQTASRTGADPSGIPDHFTANALNQVTTRENNVAHVAGTVASGSVGVSVTGGSTVSGVGRQGRYWDAQATLANQSAPAKADLTVKATLAGTTDLVRTETRTAYLPSGLQSFTYDDDGNLTSDGVWDYSYDAENRLTSMTATTAAVAGGFANQRLEFKYDYQSRRVSKLVLSWNGTGWTATSERRFLYDGWNLVAEFTLNSQLSTLNLVRTYTWGLDVAGSLTATGGAGGLLQIVDYPSGKTFLPTYDGNGNLAAIVNAGTGAIAAAYEYSPFGELLRAEVKDTAIADNPFRFSTKYTDLETGLVYYGLRYYSPAVGRFINRDPIEEAGGLNLYGFCGNDGVNRADILGMEEEKSKEPPLFGPFDIVTVVPQAEADAAGAPRRGIIQKERPSEVSASTQRQVAGQSIPALNSAGGPFRGSPQSASSLEDDPIIEAALSFLRKIPGVTLTEHLLDGKTDLARSDATTAFVDLNEIYASTVVLDYGVTAFETHIAEDVMVAEGRTARVVTNIEKAPSRAVTAENAGRQALVDTLSLRARQLELGTDPVRGFIQAEGTGGVRLEQALGRTITRSSDGAADFIDSQLGTISLKGPIPAQGSVQGLANAAIRDATMNTATRTLVIDTMGLTPAQVSALKAAVQAGTAGTSKTIIYLH
jgi:RHS repeat-associated protein